MLSKQSSGWCPFIVERCALLFPIGSPESYLFESLLAHLSTRANREYSACETDRRSPRRTNGRNPIAASVHGNWGSRQREKRVYDDSCKFDKKTSGTRFLGIADKALLLSTQNQDKIFLPFYHTNTYQIMAQKQVPILFCAIIIRKI